MHSDKDHKTQASDFAQQIGHIPIWGESYFAMQAIALLPVPRPFLGPTLDRDDSHTLQKVTCEQLVTNTLVRTARTPTQQFGAPRRLARYLVALLPVPRLLGPTLDRVRRAQPMVMQIVSVLAK